MISTSIFLSKFLFPVIPNTEQDAAYSKDILEQIETLHASRGTHAPLSGGKWSYHTALPLQHKVKLFFLYVPGTWIALFQTADKTQASQLQITTTQDKHVGLPKISEQLIQTRSVGEQGQNLETSHRLQLRQVKQMQIFISNFWETDSKQRKWLAWVFRRKQLKQALSSRSLMLRAGVGTFAPPQSQYKLPKRSIVM